MILLSFPDSLLAGLISRHFGLFSKFSSWSLSEINASRFFICSIRSPIPKLFEICFSSSSTCEMVPSDPCYTEIYSQFKKGCCPKIINLKY